MNIRHLHYYRGNTGKIILTSPKYWDIFQRNASDIGLVLVSGGVVGTSGDLQVSLDNATWPTIQEGVTGDFSATFNCPVGTHLMRVKCGTATIAIFMSVGDIYFLAGQSNCIGYGYNIYDYTQLPLFNYKLDSSNRWINMIEPFNAPGYVEGNGSFWTRMVDLLVAKGVPMGFVPCAVGGTKISAWQAGQSNYTNMVARLPYISGAKAVIWFQGEHDIIAPTSEADYTAKLNSLVNNIFADMGINTVVVRIHHGNGMNIADHQAIVNAQNSVIASNVHALAGADLSDLTNITEGTSHFLEDWEMELVAGRWANALEALYY